MKYYILNTNINRILRDTSEPLNVRVIHFGNIPLDRCSHPPKDGDKTIDLGYLPSTHAALHAARVEGYDPVKICDYC